MCQIDIHLYGASGNIYLIFSESDIMTVGQKEKTVRAALE